MRAWQDPGPRSSLLSRSEGIAGRYAAAAALWLVALAGLILAHNVLVNISAAGTWSGLTVLRRLVVTVTALLPFVAFAGGAAVAALEPMRRRGLIELACAVAGVALLFYVLAAFAVPVVEYRDMRANGVDVERILPFGPRTPSAWLRLREHVVADPPASYSYSTDRPLERPPNSIDYYVQREIAMALFAMLNGILGLLVARAVGRRRGPRRHRVLWAAGLASGVVLFAAMSTAGALVRSSLTVSGVAMAWLPLILPAGAIVWLSLGPARPAPAEEPAAGERARI